MPLLNMQGYILMEIYRCGVDAEDSIRNILIFKQIQQFKSLLATIFPENSS